jgi:uncharacterized membrane protein
LPAASSRFHGGLEFGLADLSRACRRLRGQVVGVSYVNNIATAAIWNGTTATALGMAPGGVASSAADINNRGQVVGATQFFAPNNVVATVWNGTTPTTLGYLPGTNFVELEFLAGK